MLASVVFALTALSAAPGAQQGSALARGYVCTESGRAVEHAQVAFVPDGAAGVDWLDGFLEPRIPRRGASDARGRFRVAAPAGTGCLWIEHADGLGAMRAHYATEAPERVALEPLGAVRLRGGERLVARVLVLRAHASRVDLGRREGTRVRLPAGDYLLWLESGAHSWVDRVRVEPGKVLDLDLPADGLAQEFIGPAGCRLAFADWPQVELQRDAAGAVRPPVVRGLGILRWTLDVAGGAQVFGELWYGPDGPASSEAGAVTAPEERAVVRVSTVGGSPAAGADVFVIGVRGSRARVLARARADSDGRAGLPLPDAAPGEERRILVRAADHPPTWDRLPNGAALTVELPPVDTRRILVVAPSGDPVAFASIRLRGDRMPERTFPTDLAGNAVVRVPAGSVPELEVHDAEHLPFRGLLGPRSGGSPQVVQLRDGLQLHGVAYLDDRQIAPNVRIELRDPSDTTGVRTRTVVTDDHGRFRFRGLPDALFTLSVTTERNGVTWSGRLARAQPGDTEWRLDLGNEDPPLPGRTRRGGGR